MKKKVGGLVALLAIAAVAVAASVAQGSSGKQAAAADPYCFSAANYMPVAALKAGSGRQKDLVLDQYELPTPDTGYSPFFTPNVTISVYFHVLMDGPDTIADNDATGDIP